MNGDEDRLSNKQKLKPLDIRKVYKLTCSGPILISEWAFPEQSMKGTCKGITSLILLVRSMYGTDGWRRKLTGFSTGYQRQRLKTTYISRTVASRYGILCCMSS
jgi:hypothetical protein